jgi:phosphoglycolate phosphatase
MIQYIIEKEVKIMVKLAIVDLDGTLAYTLPGMLNGINAVRRQYGCRDLGIPDLYESINYATPGFISNLIKDTPLKDDLDKAIELYLKEYSNYCIDGSIPYENIKETMLKLRSMGIHLVVFSNKDNTRVNWIIDKHFNGVFDESIGTGLYPGKPDPTGPIAIAKKYGAKPSETVFIGDSDVDVLTAKNAGMIRLNVTWGYRDRQTLIQSGSQYLADKPEDLIRIINKINKNEI